MADILAGVSGHSSYAPLSSEQTLQVCQYLHDLIKNHDVLFNSMKGQRSQDEDRMNNFDSRLKTNENNIRDIQRALQDLVTKCDAMHREINVLNMHAQKKGIDDPSERLAALQESLRLANADIQKVSQAQAQSDKIVVAVRDTVEKRVASDVEKLFDTARNLDGQIMQLRDNDQKLSETLRQQQDQVRNVISNMQGMKDDISRTEATTVHLDQRHGEMANGLKASNRIMEELNAAVLKLREDHEGTKVRVGDNMTNIKSLNQFLGVVRGDLDRSVADLNTEKRKVVEVADTLEQRRRSMERIDQNVRGVREQTNQLHMTTQVLTQDLSDAREIALKAQANLDSTNQIVLPNLVRGGTPGGLSPRGGGALTPLVPGSPLGSPSSARGRPTPGLSSTGSSVLKP